MFPEGHIERGISHALYKTDKALLSNPTGRPDVCHFSRARRSGAAGGLWPLSATSQHRWLHHSPDRLRNSAGGDALARRVSKSCTGGVSLSAQRASLLVRFCEDRCWGRYRPRPNVPALDGKLSQASPYRETNLCAVGWTHSYRAIERHARPPAGSAGGTRHQSD
jgi:hypothetical protein